jgi:hypothetical protein
MSDAADPEGRGEYVAKVRADPAQPAQRVVAFTGILGESDREGRQRVYFDRSLTYFVEFSGEHVLHVEAIPADQPPMVGTEAARVTVSEGAPVDVTRTGKVAPKDRFDIDARFTPAPELWCVDTVDTFGGCYDTLGCGTGRSDCVCITDYCTENLRDPRCRVRTALC